VFRHAECTVEYNVDSLVDYLLATRDFREPLTRAVLTDEDLHRLDGLAQAVSPLRPSVLAARHSPVHAAHARAAAVDRDGLAGLDTVVGELVAALVLAIEACRSDTDVEDAHVRFASEVFPQMTAFLANMSAMDADWTRAALTGYRAFVVGPDNHRTRDDHG
jgi:hypothetical protein